MDASNSLKIGSFERSFFFWGKEMSRKKKDLSSMEAVDRWYLFFM
jgi:hypothetical protein